MELVGTIIAVLPAQSGVSQRTGNSWMKQDYVIEVPGQYPRRCTFGIFGEDRIKQFNIQQGEQNVTVHFDIDAHEYNGRWYNEIRAYNVIRAGQQAPAPAPAATPQPNLFNQGGGQPDPYAATTPFPPAQEPQGDGSTDDLPF